jgi:CDP-glucose 4,6-dehydratase
MQIDSSQYWRSRSVLVTGCTGLLGSQLCAMLVEQGAHVVGLVRDHVATAQLFTSGTARRMTIVNGDIRDQALLERILNNYEIKTVFHLAAQAIVGAANRNPVETFDSNIKGTWTVLEAARRVPGIEQIVTASSDKAYGVHEVLPYTEDAPLQGTHPYDVSKSCADLIAQTYAHTYNLPVCIARCGNLYGGGDLHWNRLVPGTMRAAIEGTPPLIRSDGSMTRDYIYVEDGADAYLTLAQKMSEDSSLHGQAFNFGNNSPLSVLELVQQILQVAGRTDLEPEILNQANNEIPAQYLDSSRAMNVLGWQPRYTLEEGLRASLDWYRSYLAELATSQK